MMARAIWSGAINFGLINIPVKLFNAVKHKTINFNQLRSSDGCRIRLKKVCETDGQEVPAAEIIKGYEIAPDRYVTVTADELEAAMPKAKRTIEIDSFVELQQIDPIFFVQAYYLSPDRGANKAYGLLLSALEKTGKVAIANFILRNKQYLCAIKPAAKDNRALILSTMLYADEIIVATELEEVLSTTADPSDREIKMAMQLIESLTTDFKPEQYQDQYRQRILELLTKKADGQIIDAPTTNTPAAKVVDLMAALEASLAAIKQPVKARRKKHAR